MGKWRLLSRRNLFQSSALAAGALTVGAAAGPASTATALQQTPATVQDTQSSLYVATNTSYGTAFDSGTYADCAAVFVAPESGRVIIHWAGALRNIHAGIPPVAYISPEVRAGGTVGSGSVVLQADNVRSIRTNLTGAETVRAGAAHLLSGLTPSASYNARLLHRVTSQTGEFFWRSLIVEPAT